MPFIENVAKSDISSGNHYQCGEDAILIQIGDPCSEFPKPNQKFYRTFQFEFLDLERDSEGCEEFKITDEQASDIAKILMFALNEDRNVLVHCHMGICRSGAITEVGSIMGFTPTSRYRQPNLLVKHKILKALGLTYDSEEEPYEIRGYVVDKFGNRIEM